MKLQELRPVFVYYMPHWEEMEEGVLYISNEFQVANHLCACGCRGQTVTPFGQGGWTLTNQDNKITLRPSIGNFMGENPYHAHYYVTENKIEWL